MNTTFASPARHIGDSIPRDRWGRPLIAPAEGGEPIAYTRASTLAKVLDEKTALIQWKCRQTALGMSKRQDLVALARTLDPTKDKKKLNEIVETAMDAVGSDAAANLGTALHSMTELIDDGADPNSFGTEYVWHLTNYREAMKDIEIVATELFVVTDELQTAGTFDRLLRLPDGRVVVGDVKTGKDPDYPHGTATQIATYSRGHLYHPERGRIGHLPSMGIDQETGVMIHLAAESGACTLYELDLTVGWNLAQAASIVRRIYRDKPIRPYAPVSA